jgi:hypothetical protein
MNTDLALFDKYKADVTLFVSPIKDITVTDADANAVAQVHVKTLKDFDKKIDAALEALLKPHKDFVKQATAYAKEIKGPLEDAEKFIKLKQAEWATADLLRRQEAQKQLDLIRQEEERKANEERRKMELEAQAKRDAEEAILKKQQAEERKKFEAEQKKKDEAMKAFGISQEKLKQEALAARKAQEEKAAAIREEAKHKADLEFLEYNAKIDREKKEREAAIRVQEAALEASRPKNMREVPKWRVIDSSQVPDNFWIIDLVELGKSVRGGAREIPGVEIVMELVPVGR